MLVAHLFLFDYFLVAWPSCDVDDYEGTTNERKLSHSFSLSLSLSVRFSNRYSTVIVCLQCSGFSESNCPIRTAKFCVFPLYHAFVI